MSVVTKEMLKDLKQAKTLCLHHADGKTYARCIFKGEFRGKSVETETRYDLDATANVGTHNLDGFDAFLMKDYVNSYDSQTGTIIDMLKVGDDIRVHWYADYGTNGYVFAASAKRGDPHTAHEAKMTQEEIQAAKRSEYGYGMHESFQGLQSR